MHTHPGVYICFLIFMRPTRTGNVRKKNKKLKMKIFLSYNNNYNNYLIKNAVAWAGAAVDACRLIFPFSAIFV